MADKMFFSSILRSFFITCMCNGGVPASVFIYMYMRLDIRYTEIKFLMASFTVKRESDSCFSRMEYL